MTSPSSSQRSVTLPSASISLRCFASPNATLVYDSISAAVLCGANVSTNVFSEIAASVAASAGVATRMIIGSYRLEVPVLRRETNSGMRRDARDRHEARFERPFHEAEPTG